MMWDERYSQPGFAYGTEPNEFLATAAYQIPAGPVLTLGEGEGRNAAYLAGLGHRVVAVDQSEVGLAKARRLAADRGLSDAQLAGSPGQRPRLHDGEERSVEIPVGGPVHTEMHIMDTISCNFEWRRHGP